LNGAGFDNYTILTLSQTTALNFFSLDTSF